MSFKHPLAKRLRIAERRRERYRLDPAYRLARINAERARKGRPPRQSLAEVNPWGVNDRTETV